jgi:Kef-type K+ transport system membrane component KefB
MALVFVASLFTPLVLGITVGFALQETLYPEVDATSFALFLGAALAITAFPVLARILGDKGLDREPIGALALACAALEDVCAWLILAVVVAIVRADGAASFIITFALTLLFGLVMVLVVRPLLAWVARRLTGGERGLSAAMLSVVLVGLLLSAWATEQIGIHAIFGAFAFGAVMPRDSRLVGEVTLRLEDVTVLLFLPVFFASAGLKTEIATVDGAAVIVAGLIILAVAVGAKIVPVFLAGRASRLTGRDSLTLGVLMNTRGLTELVIIAIGLDLGVINEPVYAILVIVALTTTFMTAPLVDLIRGRPVPALPPLPTGLAAGGPRRILVGLEGSPADPALAELAARLAEPTGAELVLARALERPDRLARRTTIIEAADAERLAAAALEETAAAYRDQGFAVRTLVRTDPDPGLGLCESAEDLQADLVLVGFRRTLLGTDVLGGPAGGVLARSPADVAVLVDQTGRPLALGRGRTVLAPFGGGRHERAAVLLAEKVATASGAPLRVLARDATAAADLDGLGDAAAVTVAGARPREDLAAAVGQAGLVVLGAGEDWAFARHGLGGSRARLVSGIDAPVLVVRGATGGGQEMEQWLRRTRRSQLADWLGTRAGTAPAPAPAGSPPPA